MEENALVFLIIINSRLIDLITQKKLQWNQSGSNEKIKTLTTKEGKK